MTIPVTLPNLSRFLGAEQASKKTPTMRLVHHLLEKAAVRFADKTALICGARQYSYREIDQVATRLAAYLIENGVKPQDRVVVYLENSFESVVSIFGVLKAGGIFVLLNPEIKAKKLNYVLDDTGAHTLITAQYKHNIIADALTQNLPIQHLIWIDQVEGDVCGTNSLVKQSGWKASTTMPENAQLQSVKVIDIDLAALIYTSGSSGLPKGVMCAHYNMMAAVQSINGFLNNSSADIILNVLPLSFDYGLYQILLAFHAGATVVLEKSFSYSYDLVKLIHSKKITGFPIVPTLAAILCKMEKMDKIKFENLRYITNTGDTLSVALIHKLSKLFPETQLYSMYGLTECKRVSYLPPEFLKQKPTSVGIPIPNTDVFVADELGRPLEPGVVGELVVRGSHVMQGYWRLPEETQSTFRNGATRTDALLYTGDWFKRDQEGFLYFVGRKNDILKHKGQRVSPREIESAINTMKGVVNSAVIGIPDDIKGQRIVAFVQIEDDTEITNESISRHCQEHLEDFLVPHQVLFIEDLPISGNGKVDKQRLMRDHKPTEHNQVKQTI